MRIQSAPLAFIDQTDSRKLEVYIKSNLPTVQIYNSNSGVYTPNWTENGGLTLEADVFLDSRELEEDYSETYSTTWYREDTTLSTNADTLNITDNVLADTPIITYIFEATYQGITASSRITFARVDTGLNGNDGADGTSVRILGTADSVAQVPDTNYYTIVYSEGAIVAAELGDSYIYQGDLYVCSVLDGDEEGNDYFVNVGDIQGPKGDDAKVLALSGNSQTFKISGESITPSTITVAAQTFNTTATNWSYSVDGGITFDSNAPDGVVRDGDIVTITGETLSGNTLVIRVSDGPIGSDGTIYDVFTVYKVFDGDKGDTGDSAPIVFLSNEHISFVADENGLTYGGRQDFSVNVVAYSGTTKVLPEIDLALAEASLFDGMNIAIDEDTMNAIKEYNPDFEEIILKVSVSDGFNLGSALSNNGTIPITVTSPATVSLQLNWSKINTGASGVGIRSIQVKYGTTQFADKPPQNESDWEDEVSQVEVPDGHYLWTRTLIDYTDDDKDDTVTYTYVKQGINGEKGEPGTSVSVTKVRYAAHNSASVPPDKPIDEWSPVVVATSVTLPYLWTRTTFSDGQYADSVARYGTDGAKGDKGDQGIQGIQGPQGEQGVQGPKGTDGQTSYFHIKYSENANGNPMTETPSTYIGTYVDYTQADSTDYTKYTWSRFVGSQGEKGDQGIAGTNGEDGLTSYLHIAYATSADGSSGFSVSDSVNKTYIGQYTDYIEDDSTDPTKYKWTLIKGDKGDKGDQGIQGPKGADGQTSYFHIKYSANANGNPMSETPSTYIGTYVDYTANDSDDYTKYTWSRFIGSQGAKGDQGIAGTNGADGKTSYLHIAYATSANGSSGFSVSDSVNKTYIGQYTDHTEADSTDYTKYKWTLIKGDKGDKGDQGVQGPKGDDGQQLYTWIKYADTPTSGMSNDPAGKTYIGLAYNKTTATESSTYSDYMWSLIKGETGPTGPKGDNGLQYYTWIKYADNASGANMSDSPNGKLYIGLAYNKTTSTESNTASDYTWALFKGDKGDKGDDAYTVLLTNESHVFAGSISAAIASSATTQVLAYNGATSQSVTIVSVNGVTASTASTATGIAGLSFKCSALSGTSPTITFTCTTSFVSPNGTIPIVIKVGSISITKMFTYSIAFRGATGGQGNQGNPGSPATAYWLVSSAGVVQKTSAGTVVLTPSTLTFTGKSKTGTSAPIDYGCRWIIAYSTDGTNYTNAYTSTADETSKVFTLDATYKAIRARMYLAGGTTTLLDEQIIPVVADGATGAPGDDAVTFQIYSSNGYALSINTPSVTLQTFAYIGDVAITAGATYQWYAYNDAGWTAVAGATKQYLVVSRDDVTFSKSYMCKMTFNGVEYASVATIDDKNDENKVFTSKPSNYSAGDLWVVGVDYVPSGVEAGTLLRAEHTNTTYSDVDWVPATKYDDRIDKLQESLDTYNQYFSFDSTDGLRISARDANGTSSKFSTSLTNERLSFNYGNESIAYINGTKMNIKEAEIESPLTVTGKYSGSTMLQAPVINIGNFSIIVESNGSLSIVANT